MIPEKNEDRTERLNDHDTETEYSEAEEAHATRRISQKPPSEPEPDTEPDEPEKKKGLFEKLQTAYMHAREGRNPKTATPSQDRNAKSSDRSRGLMIIAVAVFFLLFVFIAMFSHSSGSRRDDQARRNKPSLGRPEQAASRGQENHGSPVPLQSADMSGQQANSDEVSPDDVKNTARLRLHPQTVKNLESVPPMDPALEAYRRSQQGIAPPVPPAAPPPTVATVAPRNESDALRKSSLVFVRNSTTGSPQATLQPASYSPEPVLLDRRGSGLLPNGSRLVARLQAAVSTAVKTPVVASIEYNYERDGEIIIPAGTKAFGELKQADRHGTVAVHFHTLQLPDGSVQKIDGTGMSLAYGLLKGSVSGSNRAKRILVRSVTGVGEMAAYLVGGPGGFGAGQLDNSILLRERIASNAGLAGEQEVTNLAVSEQIVVTVPANTRFFIVLVDSNNQNQTPGFMPSGTQHQRTQFAEANSALPSARELRELIELKSELNRMYQQVGATRTSEPAAAPSQQQQQQEQDQ